MYLAISLVSVPGVKISAMPATFRAATSSSGMMPPPRVLLRDDAAPQDQDVADPLFIQDLHHPGEEVAVGPREAAHGDDVHVLLHCGTDNLFRGLAQTGVNHLHPRVPERRADDLDTPIMAVQPRLGGQHADFSPFLHDPFSLLRLYGWGRGVRAAALTPSPNPIGGNFAWNGGASCPAIPGPLCGLGGGREGRTGTSGSWPSPHITSFTSPSARIHPRRLAECRRSLPKWREPSPPSEWGA